MARNDRVRVCRSDNGGQEESGRDLISELPDCVLHLILVLLPLVEAVRTSVLSRRWRGVWTRLPLLFFEDTLATAPPFSQPRLPDLVDGVLHRYADDVYMDDLFIWVSRRASIDDPVRFVATLADVAAQRVTSRFGLYLSPDEVNLHPEGDDEEEAAAATLNLPCFPRVMEISITFMGVVLRMPSGGTFARLTKLIIFGVRFNDGGEGISQAVSSRCPCIRSLELLTVTGLSTLALFSQSLVRMVLSRIPEMEQLLVVAKNLRQMTVAECFIQSDAPGFMRLCVPQLEELLWQDRFPEEVRQWILPRCLRKLVVAEIDLSHLILDGRTHSHFARILQLFERVDTLRLEFPMAEDREDQHNLIENFHLPRYSELEFTVNQTNHKFGPTILNLLRKCSYVRKVSLQMFSREIGYIPCSSDCSCRQLSIWRDNGINLDSLESVAMHGFSGTRDENSFIYYIMRNAKQLRKVSILLCSDANPTRRFFRKLRKLSKSGCTVDCYLHRKSALHVRNKFNL